MQMPSLQHEHGMFKSGSPWLGVGPINIQPVQFRGKTIPCLVDGEQQLALLEVVSRVYFPQRSLSSLLLVLSKLCVPTRALTMREELAFLASRIRVLDCKRIITISLLAKHHDDLQDILHVVLPGVESKASKCPEGSTSLFRPWAPGAENHQTLQTSSSVVSQNSSNNNAEDNSTELGRHKKRRLDK